MKTKRILPAIAVAALMLCGATACNTTHSHDYGEWIDGKNATCAESGTLGHYHCDGCGENFDANYNVLEDIAIGATGQHSFTATIAQDNYLAEAANCAASAKYYYSCSVCGAKGTQTFESGEPTEHPYNMTDWASDSDGHWREATCEHDLSPKDYAAHTWKTSSDETEKSCEVCHYTVDLVTSLQTPANFTYSDGKITFGAVKFATSYDVEILKGQTSVKTDSVTAAEYDITALNLAAGKYTFTAVAKYKSVKSEKATYEFTVLAVDGDVIIEAEDAVLNKKHISYDGVAHGGAYALAFDDCGQGMYFRYYAYEAAEKTVEVRYSTGSAGSYMKFFVNGTYQKNVVFSENTGWFGDTKTAATASVTLNFAQGWNEIYLIKDGTNTDNPEYGGWAQIDYIKVIGSGKKFDITQLNMQSTSYKLEAECAEWHWADTARRPAPWEDFSLGYGLGDMKEGDWFKFNFKVAESGTYKIQLGYGVDAERQFNVSVNGGEDITKSYASTGAWNNVQLDGGFTVELTAGEWQTVEFKKVGDDWINIDYILITRVSN